MRNVFEKLFERNKLNKRLHWTTIASEKTLLAVIGILTVLASIDYVWGMFKAMSIELPDLFMLFIFAEIIGMIGAFYSPNRIPVTLPIIIAMTALCRLNVMQSKDMEPSILLAEAGAVLILALAAYLMGMKDKMSLKKLEELDE